MKGQGFNQETEARIKGNYLKDKGIELSFKSILQALKDNKITPMHNCSQLRFAAMICSINKPIHFPEN